MRHPASSATLSATSRGFTSDPADGRVRLVTRTEQGDAAANAALRAMEAVERAWRQEIGDSRYETMKQAMRDLGRPSEAG